MKINIYNSKHNTALISSPGQYYNLLEYSRQFDVNLSSINLFYFGLEHEKSNIKQYYLSNKFKKINFFVFRNSQLISKFKWLIKIIFIFINILFSKKSFLISGQIWSNYHLLFSLLFKNSKIISLDEGNANIKCFTKNMYTNRLSKKIHHFTTLNLDFPNILKNKYFLLNSRIDRITKRIIYVFGSPYLNDKMMDKKKYKKYLELLSLYFVNEEIWYIPHRRESGINYFNILPKSFKVVKTIGCFELWFLNQNFSPISTVNFGSGITNSLMNIFDDKSKINIIKLAKNDFIKLSDFSMYIEIIREYEKKVTILNLKNEIH